MTDPTPRRKRDWLPLALGLVVAGTIAGGIVITRLPDQALRPDVILAKPDQPATVAQAPEKVVDLLAPEQPAGAPVAPLSGPIRTFDEHFRAGIRFMREGRPADAAAMFMQARALDPNVPEVYINLGFALIEMERFSDAEATFSKALEINPNLANAYFGLGEALHGLDDKEGALGAMRAYLHLVDEKDPFFMAAQAATWELENAVRVARGEIPPPPTVTEGQQDAAPSQDKSGG